MGLWNAVFPRVAAACVAAGVVNDKGEPIGTLASLKELLAPKFLFRGTKDLPFLIREHARKFQWSVSQASLWRRR